MTSTIWGTDANDAHFGVMIKGERTACHRGLDWIRYANDPDGALVKLLKTGTLNGTIDPHDPLWTLFLVTQGKTKMRLLTITVNWGRGYDPGEFKKNVLNVTKFAGQYDHVVIFVQELDEDDAAPEHKIFGSCLEKGTKKMGWGTHEPIVLSPDFKVPARDGHIVVTMGSGLQIGAPKGTGPVRHSVVCKAYFGDIELAFGNTHPHRNMPNKVVQKARERGARIFSHQLEGVFLS